MKSLKANNMKRLLFVSMLIPALMLVSCITDEGTDTGRPAAGVLRLSVAVEQSGIQTETRTPVASEPGEDDISALYLLFFEPDAAGNGQFVDYVEIYDLTPNVSTPIDMVGHPSLAVRAAYDILAIANIAEDPGPGHGQYVPADQNRGPIRLAILPGDNTLENRNSYSLRDTFAWWSDGLSNQ